MPLHHPNGTLPLSVGASIFDYADALRVRVPTSCGRTGECHECIVEVKRGADALNPPTAAESFLRGADYRLACQATVAKSWGGHRVRGSAPAAAHLDALDTPPRRA